MRARASPEDLMGSTVGHLWPDRERRPKKKIIAKKKLSFATILPNNSKYRKKLEKEREDFHK